jgi:hypothetical protein
MRVTLRVAMLAVVSGVALLATASPALAVANGTPVPEGQYRFAVKLTMTDIPRPDGTTYDSACSAALISSRWIITAGHCFHDVDRNPVSGLVPYSTTATVGRANLADPQGRPAASGAGGRRVAIKRPDLVGDVANVVWVQQSPSTDIAVAELDRPIIGIAPLGLSTQAPTDGEILRLTGFGAQDSVDPVPGTQLMTGQVQVSSVTSSTVGVHGYAPSPSTSACLYDSGAPYFLERPHHAPVLVGVESTGPDCPHDQEETTSRVDDIATWIQRITR